MLRLLCAALFWTLVPGLPARAALLDIQAEQAGDRMRVLFLFDTQPENATISPAGAQATGAIGGVRGQDRALRLTGGPLTGVSAAERPLGMAVALTANRPIRAAEASVFENAVLFDLVLAPGPDPAPPPPPEPEPGPGPTAEPALTAEAPSAPSESATAPPPAPDEPGGDVASDAPPPGETRTAALETEIAPAAETAGTAPDAAPPPAEPAAEDDAPPPAASDGESPAAAAGAESPAPAEPGLAVLPASDAPAAQGPARAPLPMQPGEASALLAARLDAVSCEAAAELVASDAWALDALYDHGACLARDGQAARAREIFERLITFDPNSARALVGLGALAQDAGQHALAGNYYDRAMATGPDDGLATLVRVLRGES